MASRFPCKHEKWADQRAAAARARTNRPLVMGSTPDCPWCVRESSREIVNRLIRREALEEAAKAAEDCYHGPGDHGCSHGRDIAAAIRMLAEKPLQRKSR